MVSDLRGKRPVTLRDIAARAGVSVNTVSRALTGKSGVSEETRRRIQDVAEELDYRPNQLARGLRQQRTYVIGVVITDLVNPFFTEVVEGIERTAAENGYSIILANSETRPEREELAVHTLVGRQVDGVVMVPTEISASPVQYLAERRIPFVLLGRVPGGPPAPVVINDDREGARLAVRHLIARGHRDILHLSGPQYQLNVEHSSSHMRLAGYKDALAEAGIPYRPELVLPTDGRSSGGFAAAHQALAAGLSFSAIFCFSDFVAFGAIRALRQAGLSIPEDVALIGYDDVELAELVDPPLTTVRVAKTRLGQIATHILIGLLEKKNSSVEDPRSVTLPPQLVLRESV